MQDAEHLAIAAARAAAEKQGRDILILGVGELITIVDHFVLASGSTDRQVRAMADAVEAALTGLGARPLRREGERDARWILLDYGDIVVHLFRDEDRAYYELERLWRDAPVIEWDDASSARAAR